MIRRFVAFLAAFVCLAAPAIAKPRNWSAVVTATPGGGYLVGNPKAPVKVIEYFSLTCPHCRHFAETGLAPLKANYVAKGRVSLELRTFVLNAPDLTAALLVHCAAPAKAAQLSEQVLADQPGLFDPVFKMSADAQARIQSVPDAQKASVLARETGIDKWFIAKGLAPKAVAACLADPAGQERLLAIRADGVKNYEVPGTPSFVVNGKRIEGVTWDVLEAAIKAAGS
jgi:protein-disulfide isomerase